MNATMGGMCNSASRLSVHAEQHDVAGLRVGEYSVKADKREGVEESAHAGQRHSRMQAFRPGTDFGHGEY